MGTQSSTTVANTREAMHHAFERLEEIHAKAEKYRQELIAADGGGTAALLLASDAEYQRIQAERNKAVAEFYKLANEASDEIINATARRFGARRHHHSETIDERSRGRS